MLSVVTVYKIIVACLVEKGPEETAKGAAVRGCRVCVGRWAAAVLEEPRDRFVQPVLQRVAGSHLGSPARQGAAELVEGRC